MSEASMNLGISDNFKIWLNPKETDKTKRLTLSCAQEIKRYMDHDPDHERGCLVLRQEGNEFLRMVPFTNGAPGQSRIEMDRPDDFDLMVRVYLEGRLWGWFHSHPHGRPWPSSSDLEHHTLNVNMGIYGGATKTFSIFNTADLELIEQERNMH